MNEAIRAEQLTALLAGRITAGDFPSAVYLIAEGGSAVFADALGDAVREPVRHAATLDTIYDLASLTKPLVTGLLCARCIESGELQLDAPISVYLHEFARAGLSEITPRQLLTHTSGLAAWLPLYLLARDRRDNVLQVIAEQPLASAPGERVIYSDLGFITLGLLLERISGVSLSEIAAREIFRPLELRRTFFNPARSVRESLAACESAGNAYERELCRELQHESAAAAWRLDLIWGEVHDGNAYFLGGVAGHAGLFADARETLRLAEQFIATRTQLLHADTCALFRTNMTAMLNEARALAWQLAATSDSTAGPLLPRDAFGHLGFSGTSCWIDAARARVFILLTNRTHARPLPFANINSTRRAFHTLAVQALEQQSTLKSMGNIEHEAHEEHEGHEG
ncbi:MAG: beta-lactamase family protein [Pyrinomonadaceae bacterium]|nr:beta-lactamase family protein [Pyrinomonadaceae bacterium]